MTESQSHLVGIVVVSHSRLLAEGVVQLASEMAGPDVRLLAVGGTADGAGVLVLVDLGSAVLATDMAIESLAGERKADVRISRGPLVEGAVVAAVQASIGQSLGEVLAAAEAAAELDKGVSR